MASNSGMNHDRPLDALLPELRAARSLPKTAVHTRVLEVDVEGRYEWLFVVWSDPGGPRALHQQVQRLVEATLLAELSQPPAEIAREVRHFGWLRLLAFDEVPDIERALKAFGFEPDRYVPEQYLARMSALAAEAEALGWDPPDRPVSVWRARIGHHSGALGEQLREIQKLMAERMGAEVWGQNPGGPSRLFSAYVRQLFKERIRPDLDGLRTFEMLAVQNEPGLVRWIPPVLFQALADFVGVVAQAAFGAEVAWAECALGESGLAPPPLLRIDRPDKPLHLPIGLHLLRWCVMPIAEGETVPSLADWLADQLRSVQED